MIAQLRVRFREVEVDEALIVGRSVEIDSDGELGGMVGVEPRARKLPTCRRDLRARCDRTCTPRKAGRFLLCVANRSKRSHIVAVEREQPSVVEQDPNKWGRREDRTERAAGKSAPARRPMRAEDSRRTQRLLEGRDLVDDDRSKHDVALAALGVASRCCSKKRERIGVPSRRVSCHSNERAKLNRPNCKDVARIALALFCPAVRCVEVVRAPVRKTAEIRRLGDQRGVRTGSDRFVIGGGELGQRRSRVDSGKSRTAQHCRGSTFVNRPERRDLIRTQLVENLARTHSMQGSGAEQSRFCGRRRTEADLAEQHGDSIKIAALVSLARVDEDRGEDGRFLPVALCRMWHPEGAMPRPLPYVLPQER
ncbi:MAG TPA: hypothetical protein VGN14_16040 [Candidatus Elarobacter sp.]